MRSGILVTLLASTLVLAPAGQLISQEPEAGTPQEEDRWNVLKDKGLSLLKPTSEKIHSSIEQLLGEVKKKYIHKVITTSLDNPDTYSVLFQFSLFTFARSFEEMNGDFYFGLGSEIRSSKKWSIDEISPDTGKIIKVSKKHT